MSVKQARKVVAQAVALGLIGRDEAASRHVAITRLARNPQRVLIWVEDLIVAIAQGAR